MPITLIDLDRSNAFLRLLQKVTVAANGAPTALDAALQSTLDEVCANTQWTIGHILTPSTDGSGYLVSAGIWHVDDPTQLSALRGRHADYRLAPGVGIAGRAFADGQPQHIGDVLALDHNDVDRARCLLLESMNVRAMACFPITLHDETAGVLEFFSETPFVADALLIDVVMQVGMLIGRVMERARYESVLRVALESAEAASAAKTRFMSRMNHELRTPLNAVLGFAELLQLGPLSGDGEREGVEAIEKAGDHLLSLINDILDMSRVEEGMLALTMEPVDITELVAEVMELLAPLAKSCSVSLRSEKSAGGTQRFVLADGRTLQQILVNLVANGIKYNQDGGTVTVIIDNSDNSHVRVAVADTGCGIKASQLTDLFVPFERLGSSNTIEGTGLGLSIAQQLAQAMGSVIEVHSVPGAGSRFWFVLEETVSKETPHDADAGSSPITIPSSLLAPTTVLYVEDNPGNVELVESIFKRQRPSIHLISSTLGEPVVGLALRYAPQIVLLDLDLPDISGAEVLNRLKLDSTTRRIPVLIVSADVAPAQIDRMREAGAYDYIAKPINVERFLELVDSALRISSPNEAVKLIGRQPAASVPR